MPYLKALKAFAEITGMTPDVEKATALISRRGVYIQFRLAK
jgi:hypothetical protein